jgi:ketosteroid isomerase-like protein
MSRENVDLVKGLQPDGVDMVELVSVPDEVVNEERTEFFTDDFEVRFIAEKYGRGELEAQGGDGLLAMWREWLTAWESYQLDVEEVIDAGDNVVVFAHVKARTKRDGVPMEHSPAAVWRFREGKIAAVHFYLDRAEALEAAGLPSEEFAQKSE